MPATPFASRIFQATVALVALCLIAACFAPGLKGSFLFDDFANLPAIGASGPVDNLQTLLRYVTSGKADPTGRPVALLSFLVDSRDWPANPYLFKRTNLALHLLNAALLAVLLLLIGLRLGLDHVNARRAAFIGALLWAIHPFFVSTVLYVVQREAMLCGTFTLIALLCSLHAHSRYLSGAPGGATWMLLGTGTAMLLAVLSKANGLLIPILILVLETTLPLEAGDAARRFRCLSVALFGPLAALIGGYLIWSALRSIGDGPIPIRGWTIAQRLMTEPTVLLDYVAQLWLLKPIDSSLLHDDYVVATGLLSPWYTAPAILLCIVMPLVAWVHRKRFPVVALAVLFFIAGQLMESSSLALELYFDHRNYIPAMLMFWPVGVVLARWPTRGAANAIAAASVLTLAGLTYVSATIWGQPLDQAISWAGTHPRSARAQAYAADMLATSGNLPEALGTIDLAKIRFMDEPQIAFNLLDIHCATGRLTSDDVAFAATSLRTARREPGPLLTRWFEKTIPAVQAGRCPGLKRSDLTSLLDAAIANPRIAAIPGRRQDVHHLRGALALAYGGSEEAARSFAQALLDSPTPQAALNQAAALGRAGYPSLGARHLEYFEGLPTARPFRWTDGMPWVHQIILEHQAYWPTEIDHLRASLKTAPGKTGR